MFEGTDIQQMDEYNGILPEFIIPASRGFAIKDVAEAQRAFRNLVSQWLRFGFKWVCANMRAIHH